MNCAGVSIVEFKKTKYWLEIKLFIMLYKCSNSTPPEHFPPVKLARKRLLPPPRNKFHLGLRLGFGLGLRSGVIFRGALFQGAIFLVPLKTSENWSFF